MRRCVLVSVPLLALLCACPPTSGECAVDEDCADGEECRALQESDERVCIRPFTPPDAGPDEELDPVSIEELTADDDVLAAGGTTTLRWSALNASSCAFNEGIGSVDDTGSVEVMVARTTEYTLSCQGFQGPALASVTVAVEVAILSLEVDDAQVNIGEEITVSWTAIGATACELSAPGLQVDVDADALEAGALTFAPTAGGEATLDCDGAAGPASESVPFEVARIASFTVTPAQTTAGGEVTLAWTSESVTACAVDGVTDADLTDDEATVTVDTTTDYTLTCSGFDDVDIQATTTVTVD